MKRGPACTICEHPQRAEIELSLANNVACRIIASRFDVGKDAAWRHGANHMTEELKQKLQVTGILAGDEPVDLEQLRLSESESLLQHLVALRAREYKMLDTCEKLGSPGDFAKIDARLHKNLELTAKLLGDLKTGNTVNNLTLVAAPEYHQLRVGLVQALKPFPAARDAVLEVLQQIEQVDRPALEHAA